MATSSAVVKNPPQNAAGKYQISDSVLGCGAWSVVKRCFPIAPYVPPRGRSGDEGATVSGAASKSAPELVANTTPAPRCYVVKIIEKEYLLSLTHGDVDRATAEVKREIDVLRHIPPHANIVEFVEHFETERHFLLIFEEVAGGDLCELILSSPDNKLDEAHAKAFALQLILAVLHCHLNEVVHRDIKPENVMCARNAETGEVCIKLTDFGLAKRLRHSASGGNSPSSKGGASAASAGADGASSSQHDWAHHPLHAHLSGKRIECSEIIGTPRYGAPEMFAGHINRSKYDGYTADTWSVGVVVYIMLTGSFPFSAGADANEKQMLEVINRSQLLLPNSLSPEAAEFVRGLLCRDASKRMRLWEALEHPWLADAVAAVRRNTASLAALESIVTNYGRTHSALAAFAEWERTGDPATQRSVMDAMAKELKELHDTIADIRIRNLRARLTSVDPLGSHLGAATTGGGAGRSAAPARGTSPGPGASAARRAIASPAPSPARIASPARHPAHTQQQQAAVAAAAAAGTSRIATPPRRSGTPVAATAAGAAAAAGHSTPQHQVAHRDVASDATPSTVTRLAVVAPAARGTSPTPSVRIPTRMASPLHRSTPGGIRRGTPLRPTPSPPPGARGGSAAAASSTAAKPGSAASSAPGRTTPTRTAQAAGATASRQTPPRTSPTPSTNNALSSPGGAAPGDGFGVGDSVVYKNCRAVVRFHGTTTFGPGVWMGLEMLEGNEGTNDGTSYLDKKKYFSCPKGRGVFVRASQVKAA